MSKYLHCSVSQMSLDNSYCFLFFVKKHEMNNTLFGLPVPCTYDETNGNFIVLKEDFDESLLFMTNDLKRNNMDYSEELHRKLFSGSFENKYFHIFPVHASVYHSITKSYSSMVNDLRETVNDAITSSLQLYTSACQMHQILYEEIGKETEPNDSDSHLFKVFKYKSVVDAIENYNNDKTIENACLVLDECVKVDAPINLWFAEVIGQISLNEMNQVKKGSSFDNLECYFNAYVFRAVIGTLVPNKVMRRNDMFQGSYVENYIQYHEAIIEGLKELKED